MRKIFLTICTALAVLCANSKTGDVLDVNGIKYIVVTETNEIRNVSVFGISIPMEVLSIPQKVDINGLAYDVIEIAPEAFANSKTITNVSMPHSITVIGWGAFKGCSNLRTVNFSNGLKKIERFAFDGCTLLENVALPQSLVYLGRQAFSGCETLSAISLPAALKTIGEDVFLGCCGIKNATINDDFTELSDGMFEMCYKLENVSVPRQVKRIGEYALHNCKAITSIELPQDIETIGRFAMAGCSSLSELTIPETVTIIPEGMLTNCGSLKKLSIPNSVQVIESAVFNGNKILSHVTLPSHLTSLGEGDEGGLFDGCENMTEITIPAYVEKVGNLAAFPSKLKSIFIMGNKIPDGMEKMNHYNRQGEDITIYVKKSVYDNLYATGTWNNFKVDYKIPVTMVNDKGKEVKYKTMCRDFDVDFTHTNENLESGSKKLTAYIVDDADDELAMVFMDEIFYIPSRLNANVEGYKGEDKYVGVVLKGTPGSTYYYEIGEHDYTQGAEGQWMLLDAQAYSTAAHAGTNMLKGSSDATFIGTIEMNKETGKTMTNYGINNNMFRKISGPGWMGYNKSYLSLPETMVNANLSITFTDADGATDTIRFQEFVEQSEMGEFYNLQGVRANKSSRGILVSNNKKIYVK